MLRQRQKKKKRKQVSREILENLVAEGVSFTASRITTFDDVQNYLDAIEKVPYDITPLIPRTLSVTEGERTNLPPTFFLTRESVRSAKKGKGQKSLVLNPYVRVYYKVPLLKQIGSVPTSIMLELQKLYRRI